MSSAATPVASLEVEVAALRSDKGVLRLCVTADPQNFPNCVDDARAETRSVPASEHLVRFDALPLGRYGVAVIHDENANGKLDTFAGIPREGFGFSRNPAIRFGPPKFESVRFEHQTTARKQVRMKYML